MFLAKAPNADLRDHGNSIQPITGGFAYRGFQPIKFSAFGASELNIVLQAGQLFYKPKQHVKWAHYIRICYPSSEICFYTFISLQ